MKKKRFEDELDLAALEEIFAFDLTRSGAKAIRLVRNKFESSAFAFSYRKKERSRHVLHAQEKFQTSKQGFINTNDATAISTV